MKALRAMALAVVVIFLPPVVGSADIPAPAEAAAALIQAIEADRDSLGAHEALIKFRWEELPELANRRREQARPLLQVLKSIDAQYREWELQSFRSVAMSYGIGSQLYNQEDPKARTYLLEVLGRYPDRADVYFMLSIDAERWGDNKTGSQYMLKASQLEPQNGEYAFLYANSLRELEPEKWESASLEVAMRFSSSERGAQALYWLGANAADDAKRIAAWEQLRMRFPPEKFGWSDGAMPGLFEAYLRVDPSQALQFSERMEKSSKTAREWGARASLARTYMQVSAQIAAGKATEAVALLDRLNPERDSSNVAILTRLKARTMAAAGQTQAAYESLLKRQAATPDDDTLAALNQYGAQAGKTTAQIDSELKSLRDSTARQAPPFDLEPYTADDTVSLAALHGKVVLLTFWFPGCGPCRAEFPHFEKVLRQFRGADVVYLGINGMRDQDEYVLPFMQRTGYSFVPLKGTTAVTGPEGYGTDNHGYPSNFLIDRAGRIVYADFRADDAHEEQVLTRMIESLL